MTITFTKNQAAVLSIIGCISVFLGILGDGAPLSDILLVFGGAVVCAALITPESTDLEDNDHE
jgi:hypothetical protein